MSAYGFTCIRCEKRIVMEGFSLLKPCPKAPDGGLHEALPSAFLPRGFPPQEDYEWSPA